MGGCGGVRWCDPLKFLREGGPAQDAVMIIGRHDG